MSGRLTITIPESDLELVEDEADQLNMGRIEYVRQNFYAGRRLFQSSAKLDRSLLSELIEGDQSAHISSSLSTDAEGIEDEIRTKLPVDKTRASNAEEIRKDIFGTIDEQKEQIKQALEYLDERDQISVTVDGEFYIDE